MLIELSETFEGATSVADLADSLEEAREREGSRLDRLDDEVDLGQEELGSDQLRVADARRIDRAPEVEQTVRRDRTCSDIGAPLSPNCAN